MRCTRAESMLAKFARAAIFRPDIVNPGTVLPRARLFPFNGHDGLESTL